MKFKMVDELESLVITMGSDADQEDIDDFVKFIWKKAEQRGLVVTRKDKREDEGRNLERDNGENVWAYGWEGWYWCLCGGQKRG